MRGPRSILFEVEKRRIYPVSWNFSLLRLPKYEVLETRLGFKKVLSYLFRDFLLKYELNKWHLDSC